MIPWFRGRLGHESITTTVDRYGHLLDSANEEVVAAMEWAMSPVGTAPTTEELASAA